ncbi:site-specific integrase [Rhodopseudomonas pseudopalustris]|uniref:Site-specific recombinase XerD n=1 Tax=Rhodopseudomonas pseudopalustris TaxID=1513892 RepID=A0A1H8VWW0_9BRAD|nr:site-specific integrase [Rhodopseudomonas pseudopalustris]SEP19932.1 Site-specific recombinase XerD [Rhodopseudomonas pseudopalustris]
MKGSIRERSPGHWAIILDTPDPASGKRRRKWHSFTGTKRQAQVECARLISAMKGGTYLEPDKTTLAAFLDRWIHHIKAHVSPRSHERYADLARKNIAPLLGGIVLSKLRPAQIAASYTTALASGRRDGKGGLSPRTVHHMHRVLKQALGQAVKWELLNRNPCDAVDPPKVERVSMHTFDLPQTAELIDALRNTRMLVPALLAVLCGLRRGEIAALRWRNVDVTAGQIAVVESAEETKDGVRYKEPKSGRARTVALSSTMIDELKAHRARQAQELLRLGVRLSDDSFVVAQADAHPLKPTSITHEWVRLLGQTALPRIRFHDLRHAHATHMLASGVHPKIASERLGHSKVGITLDLYSHVLPGMQADAVVRVDDALRDAINKRTKSIG